MNWHEDRAQSLLGHWTIYIIEKKIIIIIIIIRILFFGRSCATKFRLFYNNKNIYKWNDETSDNNTLINDSIILYTHHRILHRWSDLWNRHRESWFGLAMDPTTATRSSRFIVVNRPLILNTSGATVHNIIIILQIVRWIGVIGHGIRSGYA